MSDDRTPTKAVVMHGPWPDRCADAFHVMRARTLTCTEPPGHPLPHGCVLDGRRVTWRPDEPRRPHDGWTPHPDLTPALADAVATARSDLAVCVLDHPEDERLMRVEGALRWLLGGRV